MIHELPKLPYEMSALAPYISEETLNYHYGKHHKTYVDNLNKLIVDTEFAELPLLEIIRYAPKGAIFNNAAQVWNHTFYFEGLAPASNKELPQNIADMINSKWGSIATFREEFNKKAIANFGSGWTWLILNDSGELEIINTDDAETPAVEKMFTPLLTCDIWEHAYYIDVRNARAEYLENFWKVVNWEKISERFESKNTHDKE